MMHLYPQEGLDLHLNIKYFIQLKYSSLHFAAISTTVINKAAIIKCYSVMKNYSNKRVN